MILCQKTHKFLSKTLSLYLNVLSKAQRYQYIDILIKWFSIRYNIDTIFDIKIKKSIRYVDRSFSLNHWWATLLMSHFDQQEIFNVVLSQLWSACVRSDVSTQKLLLDRQICKTRTIQNKRKKQRLRKSMRVLKYAYRPRALPRDAVHSRQIFKKSGQNYFFALNGLEVVLKPFSINFTSK